MKTNVSKSLIATALIYVFFCRNFKAMAMARPIQEPTYWKEKNKNVYNCSRAAWKYRRHIDIFDISNNKDSSQEQTCLQDIACVRISNVHYLGFGGHGTRSFVLLFLNC